MTKCFVLNDAVINVGPWDYQEQADEAGGVVVWNPLPVGAVEADLPLAWTADGRIVLASDPAAATPYAAQ